MQNTPSHLRHVHPISAWLAVINAAFLGVMLPSLMYAQSLGDFSFPMSATEPAQPMQGQLDPTQCINSRCAPLKQDCLAKVGDNAEAMKQCEQAVNGCIASCQGTKPTDSTNLQPFVQGNQNFQFNPGMPSGQPGNFQGQPGNMPSGQFNGQPGQMPGGNFQGSEGQFQGMNGPDQEQMEKMQQQQEAQMKQQQAKELERVKKQMSSFGKQMTSIKNRVAALAKKGVSAPSELTAALAKTDELMAKIKAAQSFDDMEGIPEEMQEVGEIIREQMPNLERLANVKTIYSRIDKQLKSFDKMLAQDKTLVKKSKVDLSEALTEFEQNLANLKTGYAAAKQLIASGSVEEGFDALESDVFDKMDEVGENHNIIQQIGRMQTTITQAGREITTNQRQIDTLKRAKKDVTAVQAIINEAKVKLAELKTLAEAKPFDPEPVFDALAEMEDLRDQFMHEMNLLKGVQETDDVDQGIKMQQFSPPDLSAFGGMGGGTQ